VIALIECHFNVALEPALESMLPSSAVLHAELRGCKSASNALLVQEIRMHLAECRDKNNILYGVKICKTVILHVYFMVVKLDLLQYGRTQSGVHKSHMSCHPGN
jgi:hypothetical protein